MTTWRQWERDNASKYHGERVTVLGEELTVHRFNPNIVAVTVVAVQEINGKGKRIHRVVTSVLDGNSLRPMFKTSADTRESAGIFWADSRELDKALEQHDTMVGNLCRSVRNPKWRIDSVTEYVKGEEWDRKAANQYNLAYGLWTYVRFNEIPVGHTFGLNTASNSYTKVSNTQARWSDKAPSDFPADYWVLVDKPFGN